MSIWSDMQDRSSGKTVRKEDELLEKEEILFLQACTLLPFKIGSFSSIDDLLEKLGVCIQIAPGIKYHVVPSELLQEKEMQEAEERGICGQVSPTSPHSYQEWQIKLDILEMTVEQVLQDER